MVGYSFRDLIISLTSWNIEICFTGNLNDTKHLICGHSLITSSHLFKCQVVIYLQDNGWGTTNVKRNTWKYAQMLD